MHRQPNIVVESKSEKECLIDVAVARDTRIKQEEQEKIEKYQNLTKGMLIIQFIYKWLDEID